jgi:hypothetical protein
MLTYWARNVPMSNARSSWYEPLKSMATTYSSPSGLSPPMKMFLG